MSEPLTKLRVDGADMNAAATALVTAFVAAGLDVLALANEPGKRTVPGFDTIASADGTFFKVSIQAMPDDYRPELGTKPGPETVVGGRDDEEITVGLRGDMPCVFFKVRVETSHDKARCEHTKEAAHG